MRYLGRLLTRALQIWRDGQRLPVFIYRLISTGTVEGLSLSLSLSHPLVVRFYSLGGLE